MCSFAHDFTRGTFFGQKIKLRAIVNLARQSTIFGTISPLSSCQYGGLTAPTTELRAGVTFVDLGSCERSRGEVDNDVLVAPGSSRAADLLHFSLSKGDHL